MPDGSLLVNVDLATDASDLATCQVIGVTCVEAIGEPYRLSVLLLSQEQSDAVDLASVLHQQLTISLVEGNKEFHFQGVIAAIEHRGCSPALRHTYAVEVVPPVALLASTKRCRIFNELTIPDVIQKVLGEYHISASLHLTATYPVRHHVMQYEESDLAFVTRLMEQEGIVAFHAYGSNGTGSAPVLTLIDATSGHPDLSLTLSAATDLLPVDGTLVVVRQEIPVKSATVQDYDPKHPGQTLAQTAKLSVGAVNAALGERYEFDQQLALTNDDVTRYAQVRLQQTACRQQEVELTTSVFRIRPGYLISLADHAVDAFNTTYLVTKAEHSFDTGTYTNSLTLVPKSLLPWRQAAATPIPRIPGYLLARIGAVAGNQNEQEVDGAYAVSLVAEETAASRVVRMAQPYGGESRGMHFPLPVGTEVLLGHVHGHPDRPFIAGALPNTDAPSVVQDANHTQAKLQTAANHVLVFEDDSSTQQVELTTGGGHQLKLVDKPDDQALIVLQTHGGHILALKDNSEKPTATLATNGGHRLLMDDTSDAPAVTLSTTGGHQIALADKPDAPTLTLKTTGGHQVLLDDTAAGPKVAIASAQGHKLTLDSTPAAGKIAVASTNGHQLTLDDTAGNSQITIASTGGQKLLMKDMPPQITLTSGGMLSIESQISLSIKCGASQISMDAEGNISIQGVKLSISGAEIAVAADAEMSLNGGATLKAQAGIIQLN